MAQWIRRWSTEPEILGSIPSGVVFFLAFFSNLKSFLTAWGQILKQRRVRPSVAAIRNSTSCFHVPAPPSNVDLTRHAALLPLGLSQVNMVKNASLNSKEGYW
ncbi:hypothetical protein AB3S75_007480 [Citrus x aurantiifolia]